MIWLFWKSHLTTMFFGLKYKKIKILIIGSLFLVSINASVQNNNIYYLVEGLFFLFLITIYAFSKKNKIFEGQLKNIKESTEELNKKLEYEGIEEEERNKILIKNILKGMIRNVALSNSIKYKDNDHKSKTEWRASVMIYNKTEKLLESYVLVNYLTLPENEKLEYRNSICWAVYTETLKSRIYTNNLKRCKQFKKENLKGFSEEKYAGSMACFRMDKNGNKIGTVQIVSHFKNAFDEKNIDHMLWPMTEMIAHLIPEEQVIQGATPTAKIVNISDKHRPPMP